MNTAIYTILNINNRQLITGVTNDFNIDVNVLEPTQSKILLTENDALNVEQGSIIYIKRENSDTRKINNSGPTNFIFSGIVSGIENNYATLAPIDNFFAYNVIFTTQSGDDLQSHFINDFFRSSDSDYLSQIAMISDGTKIRFDDVSESRYDNVQLNDILLDYFKKYGVYPLLTGFDRKTYIPTYTYMHSKNIYSFSDNVASIFNWKVVLSPVKYEHTGVNIIYTSQLRDPNPAHYFYILNDGTITSSFVGINKPFNISKVLIDDISNDGTIATPESAASDALKKMQYSHNIQFDVDMFSNIYDDSIINNLGAYVNIKYKNNLLKSVFSGYTIKSGESLITLKFGNQNVGITSIFKK